MKQQEELCHARNWSDPFWKVHVCRLPKGHPEPQHQCFAAVREHGRRGKGKKLTYLPCGFSWPVPEEVFELYKENS